ncbi:ABC transporter ATP-binding protein [Halogeometricum limi]|uniref:Branched-chain amino acid transport system ATP-binding protein n=1 Tax=Halogeometricum limi TaxID=555875 RepID=A0A1I6IAY5_9EURY|nr:ABC transporter ATP-binding protein [Halogeometricum limi]SFR63975.1 branched-chain amino acid transport system ATP-binding protein [Halogeometricum limi]
MSDPLLSVDGIDAAYGQSQILRDLSLSVERGEVVSLVGRNGAGKTTTLRAILGILTPSAGTVTFDGDDVTHRPDYETVARGIQYVPEDRQVFPDLSVDENLRLGELKSKGAGTLTMEEVFERFPRLRERRANKGSQLSGGEQQMLVIARALVGKTDLLMLDEPTEGLAPQIVEDVIEIIESINDEGVTVLLVEQNVQAAMSVADRHYVINKGQNVFEGTTDEIRAADDVLEEHLGVGGESELSL